MKSKFLKSILALALVVVMAVSTMAISVVSASACNIPPFITIRTYDGTLVDLHGNPVPEDPFLPIDYTDSMLKDNFR